MKISKFLLCGMLAVLSLNSCSNDDDNIIDSPDETGTYTNGLFVLNEGSSTAGTVTYVSNDFVTVENEIYQANNTDDLGTFLQSIFFDDDHAFIISNGSNMITVVDRYTFEFVDRIDSELQVPYYGAVVNGKAYVTNLAGFDSNTDDYVAVINLETFEIEETINVNATAENILAEDGLLYIQNASFGMGNTISVLNPVTNSIENVIEVNDGLNSIDIENGQLYALTSMGIEVINLSDGESALEIPFLEGLTGASNIDVEDGMIYFTVGNSVYAIQADANEVSTEALIEYSSESQWGVMYGFEVEDGKVYIADGGDFSSNSFIEIYTTAGELLDKIEVGVGPNSFYFND